MHFNCGRFFDCGIKLFLLMLNDFSLFSTINNVFTKVEKNLPLVSFKHKSQEKSFQLYNDKLEKEMIRSYATFLLSHS